MKSTLGITGPVLEWFCSYLGDRTLRVQIDDSFSASQEDLWSVPQGSVMGPLLFPIYLLPLGILIRKHGLELHAYADDTQLYISIKPINQHVVDEGVAKLENCLTDIYTWMSQNKLKLNADKTEALVMGTPQIKSYQVCKLPLSERWKIRKHFNTDTTKSAIVSLVTSRLD